MTTAAPKCGGAEIDRRRSARPDTSTISAAASQELSALRILRGRLAGARRRLLERLADDFPPDRRFPDTGWTRMLADIQAAIMAGDAVIAEGGP